ncbi:MAG: iron-sulfur cluster assembly accessory protein [Candidatus Lindowbacteria bacterium]|nr:iron-sulfur cluster assembly accessory protein [Candidatus Lindowbacteria bacterium]
MAIEVTDKAAAEVQRLMEAQNKTESAGLRVGVAGGGCSGFSYKLDIADEPTDQDKVFESKGVRLFVDNKSYLFLNGLTLDYIDTLMERRFVFNNPNAEKTCGCGQSFGV